MKRIKMDRNEKQTRKLSFKLDPKREEEEEERRGRELDILSVIVK